MWFVGTIREAQSRAHFRGRGSRHRIGRVRLVTTIMGAVSQWEREAIGERTRDALRHKRSKGERVGNIEFGYRLSSDLRHLEPDPTEQTALGVIRDLRRQGHPLRGIVAFLNSRGLRTRRGTEWRLESVARVVKHGT